MLIEMTILSILIFDFILIRIWMQEKKTGLRIVK